MCFAENLVATSFWCAVFLYLVYLCMTKSSAGIFLNYRGIQSIWNHVSAGSVFFGYNGKIRNLFLSRLTRKSVLQAFHFKYFFEAEGKLVRWNK